MNLSSSKRRTRLLVCTLMAFINFHRFWATSARRSLAFASLRSTNSPYCPWFANAHQPTCIFSSSTATSHGDTFGNQTAASSTPTILTDDSIDATYNPWNNTNDESKRNPRSRKTRFRQHVNPLARRYQQPAILSPDWPNDVISDLSLPLHIDIGCGKGGFLLEMAAANTDTNYLGLEIRPSVFQFALDRVEKRGLDGRLTFVGCNVNVDLERLLELYQHAGGTPKTISIQFPDPHFKAAHTKRRVVTPALVLTLAKSLEENAVVFLQSDIQDVLDDMRLQFRAANIYFRDEIEEEAQYMEENPMGIQTEREVSVLKQGLPVYRTVLRRTATPFIDE